MLISLFTLSVFRHRNVHPSFFLFFTGNWYYLQCKMPRNLLRLFKTTSRKSWTFHCMNVLKDYLCIGRREIAGTDTTSASSYDTDATHRDKYFTTANYYLLGLAKLGPEDLWKADHCQASLSEFRCLFFWTLKLWIRIMSRIWPSQRSVAHSLSRS